MKYRSCDCKHVPEFDPWADDTPEGVFKWESEYNGEYPAIRTLKIMMPYDHPKNCHSLHILRVVPGKQVVILDAEGKPKGKQWVPYTPGEEVHISRPWWFWDGNIEKPTLHPSIRCGPKEQEHWHGFLRKGRLEACE